jgi:hypothetical protein
LGRAATTLEIYAIVVSTHLVPGLGNIQMATAVILAAITGARRGELCGLQWLDVDWDMGILRIERQRVPVTGGDATVPTKTKQVRRIALGPGGLEVLRRYSAALDERAAALEIKRPANGWLLSYDCGCTPMRAKSLGAKITGLGKAIDAPVTTHLLRYFVATEMVGAGVDPRTAAGRLGHTPEMLLRVYASFLPQRDLEAAPGLERKVLEPWLSSGCLAARPARSFRSPRSVLVGGAGFVHRTTTVPARPPGPRRRSKAKARSRKARSRIAPAGALGAVHSGRLRRCREGGVGM